MKKSIPKRRLTPVQSAAKKADLIGALRKYFNTGLVTLDGDEVFVKLKSLPGHLSATEVLIRRAIGDAKFEFSVNGAGKICTRDNHGARWLAQLKDLTVTISCAGTAKRPCLNLDFLSLDDMW